MENDDSYTDQLARSARLHESARRKPNDGALFGKILVAVDSSATSCEALHLVVQMARLFSSEIFCLYVVEVPYGTGEAAFIAQNMKGVSAAERNGRRKLMQLLKEQRYDRANGKVVAGTPYHEILKEAAAADIDLIVVGSHGQSGIKRFLLGSTSERVTRPLRMSCWYTAQVIQSRRKKGQAN